MPTILSSPGEEPGEVDTCNASTTKYWSPAKELTLLPSLSALPEGSSMLTEMEDEQRRKVPPALHRTAGAMTLFSSKLSLTSQKTREMADYHVEGTKGLESILLENHKLQMDIEEELLFKKALKDKEAAVGREKDAFVAQARKPSFVLKSKTNMLDRLLKTDNECEMVTSKRNDGEVNKFASLLEDVEASRILSQRAIDRQMMIVVERATKNSSDLNATNCSIIEAEQKLLDCRQQRVREEAWVLDFFKRDVGSIGHTGSHADHMHIPIKHTTVRGTINKGHKEMEDLFQSPNEEIDLIEIVPHTKRLMALQEISNKFTNLGAVASSLNLILKSTFSMADLDPVKALGTSLDIAKRVLKARAVYFYKVQSGKMKCISPNSALSPAVSVGRGLAGYCAQTGSAVCVEDQHKHPSYNVDYDHQVSGSAPTPVMCIVLKCPATGVLPGQGGVEVVIKAIGKTDGEERFSQDDYYFAKVICSTISKSLALAQVYSSYRSHDLVHKKLINMVKTLTSQLDNTRLMRTIADAGAQLVDAEMCVIYQMDRRTSELVAYCSGRGKSFRRAVSGLVGTTFVRGTNLNLPDVRKHSLFEPTLDNLPSVKPRSMLLVAVLSHLGVPIGLLQAVNKSKEKSETLCPVYTEDSGFTQRDEQILVSLANQVAVTLENCQRFSQRMEKNIDVKKVVVQMTMGEAVKEIACELRDKLNCESSVIFVLEENSQQMTLHAVQARDNVHFPITKGVAGRVASTGKAVNVREARAEPDFDKNVDGHGLAVSTVLCVPVIDSNTKKVIAVLENVNKRRAYFDREDESFCEKCAMRASILLSNARQHDRSLATEERMWCLSKHMRFLLEAKNSLLRFCLAIEDLCNNLIHSQCSAFLIQDQKGDLVLPNTPGGKELGSLQEMQPGGEFLHSREFTEIVVSDLQENEFSGETIQPVRLICVPTFNPSDRQGAPLGLLCAKRQAINQTSPEEKRMLSIITERLSKMMIANTALRTGT